MSSNLPRIIVFLSVGLTGALSGLWTQRWAAPISEDTVAALTQLPLSAGEWDGRELPVAPGEIQAAQATAMVRRQYLNRRTGQVVSALLISGRPGPIAVHTPDICFASVGYEPLDKPARVTAPGGEGSTFWVLNFQRTGLVGTRLCAYYAWGYGSVWSAADNPRLDFAGRPILFKLYVVCEKADAAHSRLKDPIPELLRSLLPLLRTSLAPIA